MKVSTHLADMYSADALRMKVEALQEKLAAAQLYDVPRERRNLRAQLRNYGDAFIIRQAREQAREVRS